MKVFTEIMDAYLQAQNSYYFDFIKGKIGQLMQVTKIHKHKF